MLAKFRDRVRPGSQSWRWTLGPLGAAYLAARDGNPAPRPSAIRDRTDRLATNPRLGHLLGVNQFFVDLAAHARANPDAKLTKWWSERTCTQQITGEIVHPDGHGIWTDHGHTIAFWLEHDRGTEPRHRIMSKLNDYQRLRQAIAVNHIILIHLDSPERESSLQRGLAEHPAVLSSDLSVATSTNDHQPAGPVWRPAGHPHQLRLADLPPPRSA